MPLFAMGCYWRVLRKISEPAFPEQLRLYIEKTGKSKFIIYFYCFIGPLFVAYMAVFLLSISPALLTKEFAYIAFEKQATISSFTCESGFYNKSYAIPENTEITFKDNLAVGQNSITLGINICSAIPNYKNLYGKTITLYGRKWFLGSYVDGFRYPNLDTKPEINTPIKKTVAFQKLPETKLNLDKTYQFNQW
ncbi:MAG TPA: hypothetical protein VGV92_09125 [Gammaproteobacteria bacterium]|nr:hypothetical protein [Gammaproteobacteria bacterium]